MLWVNVQVFGLSAFTRNNISYRRVRINLINDDDIGDGVEMIVGRLSRWLT